MDDRPSPRQALGLALAAVGLFLATDGPLDRLRAARLPKNLAAVRPGAVYRSGQLSDECLRRVVRDVGLKSVVCLNPGEAPAEEATCRELGVAWTPLPMPGDGRGQPDRFAAALAILEDPACQPALVHCHAGAYRTGVAVALLRRREGWGWPAVFREMARHGCRIRDDADLAAFVERLDAGGAGQPAANRLTSSRTAAK